MKSILSFSLLILICFCGAFGQMQQLTVEGLTFTAQPFYEINLKDGASGLYAVVTVRSLNTTLNVNSGIDYRGKNYGYLDFNGQLKPYFDAIRVTSLYIRVEYSGTLCDHTPAIEKSWNDGGDTQGNALCNVPKGGSVQVTKFDIQRITGTTGIKLLQQKIDELEQLQSSSNSQPLSSEQKSNSNQPEAKDVNQNESNKSNTNEIRERVNELINEGDALYYKGSYTEAIQKYDEALRLNPGSTRAENNRANAANKINQASREQQRKAEAEVKQTTVQDFTNVSTDIARNITSDNEGRFGFLYASNGDLDNIGISFGNTDVLHMNMGFDISAFRSMFISMDIMGINPFRNKQLRLVPAVGLYMQFPEQDENGNAIEDTPDFSALQFGATGIIDMGGFYLKVGGLFDTFYFNETVKPSSNFTMMIGIGFGKD